MARDRPRLLVVDVAASGRDDPAFQAVLDALSERVVATAALVGLDAVRVPAAETGPEALLAALADSDAVVLTGGEDVDPACYGGDDEHEGRGRTFPEADAAQVALVLEAVRTRTPLVGLCRGMQLVNVALGGDLVQHLTGHVRPGDPRRSMVDHDVALDPDSDTARVLGTTDPVVRSSHHQAVARPGTGLRVVGRAPDGTAEALEHESAPLWCVQWHPEDEGARGDGLAALLRAARDATRAPGRA